MSNRIITPWQQLQMLLAQPSITTNGFHCAQCQGLLPLFVTDEMMGKPVDTLYPLVARHLDDCRACLSEYEALSKLMDLALYG